MNETERSPWLLKPLRDPVDSLESDNRLPVLFFSGNPSSSRVSRDGS
jgi:hypothetical protein